MNGAAANPEGRCAPVTPYLVHLSAGEPHSTRAAPPRWKSAIVTWLGVNLAAWPLTFWFKPLLADWPWLASFLTYNAAIVAMLVWVVMPPLQRLFRDWLAPTSQAAEGSQDGEGHAARST